MRLWRKCERRDDRDVLQGLQREKEEKIDFFLVVFSHK